MIPADPAWSFEGFLTAPDAIALSEYEYTDALRLNELDAKMFLSTVARDYPQRVVFAQPIEVFGIRFTNPEMSGDQLPRQNIPIDMLYTNPTTVVYTKK